MSGSQMPLPMPYNTGHNLLRVGCGALRAGKHGDRLSIETGRVHLADLSQAGTGFILQPREQTLHCESSDRLRVPTIGPSN
jgi:hypothetical protein